jgi:hypothetical protein
MQTSADRRVLVVATVLSMGLLVFATAIIGEAPRAAATGEEVVAWYRQHGSVVRWSVWTITASLPPLAVMVAYLRRLLPQPHRDVYLLGWIGVLVLGVISAMFSAGLALHADQLQPAMARTILDVSLFFGPTLTGFTVTMMSPVTLLALRGRAGIPRWLGILGVVAIAEQALETVTIFGTTGFTEPGGPMNLQLGAALVLGWMLAFGLWAGIRGPAAQAN